MVDEEGHGVGIGKASNGPGVGAGVRMLCIGTGVMVVIVAMVSTTGHRPIKGIGAPSASGAGAMVVGITVGTNSAIGFPQHFLLAQQKIMRGHGMTIKTRPRRTTVKRTVKPKAAPKASKKLTLLPVMRPAQNMREIIKQLIMLEDHLFQKCKRCKDCINKHMVMIEGLAEECGTLCSAKNAGVAADSARIASQVRMAHHAHAQAPKDPRVCAEIGERLRLLRKELMAKYATLPPEQLPTEERNGVHDILKSAKRRSKAA